MDLILRKQINCKSMVPEAGIEPARLAAGDFESPASTNFTTRADCEESDYDIFILVLWLRLGRVLLVS